MAYGSAGNADTPPWMVGRCESAASTAGGVLRLRRFGKRVDEPIADTGQGFDELRRAGGVAERLAQSGYGVIQAVIEIDVDAGWPDLLSHLVARDDVTGALEQECQDLERLVLQAYPLPSLRSSRERRSASKLPKRMTCDRSGTVVHFGVALPSKGVCHL